MYKIEQISNNVKSLQREKISQIKCLSFSVISSFLNLDKDLFQKQQQVPDQRVVRTPYGGRLVVTMPYGNSLVVHFKDKTLIRHKKRWSQVGKNYFS